MAITISRKAALIGGIVLFVVLVGVGGYIAWRASQPKDVTPDESWAEEPNCCYDNVWGPSYTCCDPEDMGQPGHEDCVHTWVEGWTACNDHECGLAGCCINDGDQTQTCDADSDCCSGDCNESTGVCGETVVACSCDDYDANGGCGSGCDFPGFTCPTGQMAYCGDTSNPTCVPLDGSTACRVQCAETCTGFGSCRNPEDIKVYSGSDASQCASADYSDTFTRDCDLCGNPVGCIICCNYPDEPPPPSETCPNDELDAGEECERGNPPDHECDWNSDECDQSDCTCSTTPEPICGDGILGNTPGEQCEVGDPAGHTCDWASCNQASCTCVPTSDLQVQGRVYCQDPNSPLYPLSGVTINLYSGLTGQTTQYTTNAEGYYTTPVMTTQGGYAIRFGSLPPACLGGACLLPTGQPYADMVGPVLGDPSKCCDAGCPCGVGNPGSCAANYEWCTALSEGLNSGFNWVYTNCDVNPPVEGWEMTKEGSLVCYEEGTENVYADVSYTITVTQTGDGGFISEIRDTYDDSVTADMILSTTPAADTSTPGVIVWTFNPAEQLGPNESLSVSYVVRVPRALLGTEIFNEARATIPGDVPEYLYANEAVFLVCDLPDTGLFDSVAVRIGLGVLLLGLGFAYFKFGLFEEVASLFVKGGDAATARFTKEGRKSIWESRMIRRAESRRRK